MLLTTAANSESDRRASEPRDRECRRTLVRVHKCPEWRVADDAVELSGILPVAKSRGSGCVAEPDLGTMIRSM